MLYVRGNRKDYDAWEALGNQGWGYDNVLRYFKVCTFFTFHFEMLKLYFCTTAFKKREIIFKRGKLLNTILIMQFIFLYRNPKIIETRI